MAFPPESSSGAARASGYYDRLTCRNKNCGGAGQNLRQDRAAAPAHGTPSPGRPDSIFQPAPGWFPPGGSPASRNGPK
jgi:hypothetical protein